MEFESTPASFASDTSDANETSTTRRRSSFAERAVLEALSGMRHGTLQVRLPDGTMRQFGTPGDDRIRAEMHVRSAGLFRRCIWFGPIGFAESFMEGEWTTPDLAGVLSWFLLNADDSTVLENSPTRSKRLGLLQMFNRLLHLLRPNTKALSRRNISEHYDLSNEFFRLWLDPSMTYSSGIFASPSTSLEEAQEAKYDRLCRMLRITPDCHVLEIGCGWGGFAEYAAGKYGCRITGVTISERQHAYATERMRRAGLAERVSIELRDYRDIEGCFDRIVSIEMLEAVGDRFLETFFAKVQQLSKRDGLVGLQFITCPDSRFEALRKGVDFIQKHIFPGSLLLSLNRVNDAIRRTGDLWLHDLRDIGLDYAKTLRIWHERFAAQTDAVMRMGFDEGFMRKWRYYLAYCEAGFAMRQISVVQTVHARPNNRLLSEFPRSAVSGS